VLSNPVRPEFQDIIDEAWGDQVSDMVVRRYVDTAARDSDLGAFTPATLDGQVVAIVPAPPGVPYLQQHNGIGWATVGSAVPEPLLAGALTQSFTDPSGEVWIANGNVAAGAWQRASGVLHARVYRNAAFSLLTGSGTPIAFDTASEDPFGLLLTTGYPGEISIPVPGRWQIITAVQVQGTGGASFANMQIQRRPSGGSPGNLAFPVFHLSGTVAGHSMIHPITIHLNAGDQIRVVATAGTAALVGNPGQLVTTMCVDYLGP
jgi:hypothetical protein